MLFVENKGYDGGAITLTGDSIIYLGANSSIIFVRNHAYHSGGAICYVDNYKEDFKLAPTMSKFFFGFLITFKYNYLRSLCNAIQRKHISIQFCNNTAEFAGTAIYGGWLDLCQLHVNYQVMSKNQDGIYQAAVFHSLFHFTSPHNNFHSYLLIQHAYVCALKCPSLTAVSPSTLSQPILERHLQYLQLL